METLRGYVTVNIFLFLISELILDLVLVLVHVELLQIKERT